MQTFFGLRWVCSPYQSHRIFLGIYLGHLCSHSPPGSVRCVCQFLAIEVGGRCASVCLYWNSLLRFWKLSCVSSVNLCWEKVLHWHLWMDWPPFWFRAQKEQEKKSAAAGYIGLVEPWIKNACHWALSVGTWSGLSSLSVEDRAGVYSPLSRSRWQVGRMDTKWTWNWKLFGLYLYYFHRPLKLLLPCIYHDKTPIAPCWKSKTIIMQTTSWDIRK